MGESKEVCRSCLSNESGLLSMNSIVEGSIMIKDCLKLHLNVYTAHHEGLPQTICRNCYESVLHIRKFHLRYLQSEEHLLEQYLHSTEQKRGAQDSQDTLDRKNETNPSKDSKLGERSVETSNDTELVSTDDCDDDAEEDGSTASEETDYESKTFKGGARNIYRRPHPRLIYCIQCNQEFGNRNELRTHFNSEHGEDNARGFCTQCSKIFPTRGALMIHLYSHSAGKTFRKRRENALHRRKTKLHKCPICGRGFMQASGLGMHMKVHSSKTFDCPECGKKFSSMASLNVHFKSHDTIQKYECHLCDKKYLNKRNLDEHLANHSKSKAFACELCGISFKTKDVLENHKMMHSIPYQCPRCPAKSTSLYSYRMHLIKMHAIGSSKLVTKRESLET